MAVSKRLRFEVFRRDNHACRYCGADAPEAKLQIDHVVPVALGGTDEPANLVTACSECNSGKSSMPADAALIGDVAADALRWAEAMKLAARQRASEMEQDEERCDLFECAWTARWWVKPGYTDPTKSRYRHPGRRYAPQPANWRDTVRTFHSHALDHEFLSFAIRQSIENERVDREGKWAYFCGICWRELDKRREIAAEILAEIGGD